MLAGALARNSRRRDPRADLSGPIDHTRIGWSARGGLKSAPTMMLDWPEMTGDLDKEMTGDLDKEMTGDLDNLWCWLD